MEDTNLTRGPYYKTLYGATTLSTTTLSTITFIIKGYFTTIAYTTLVMKTLSIIEDIMPSVIILSVSFYLL
jgi:hypothetical protein